MKIGHRCHVTRWGGNDRKSGKKLASQDQLRIRELLDKVLDKCTTMPSGDAKKEWKDFLEVPEASAGSSRPGKAFISPNLPKRSNKWPAFLKWCSDNGAYLGSVSIKDLPGGEYGFIADEQIEESNQFLEMIPIMMSMSNVALAMFLILEFCAGESSFWHPYISTLPASFNTVLYFSVEELELLHGSTVLDEALKLHRSIARQYSYFHKIFRTHPLAKSLPYKDCFTYDLYRWAVSAVMTRQNAVPLTDTAGGDDEDGTDAMTAMIFTDYDISANMLRCYAMRDFEKKARSPHFIIYPLVLPLNCSNWDGLLPRFQVTIFYGRRTNAEFFIHNGFVFPENRHDSVDIKLGISKQDPLYAVKAKLCDDHELTPSGIFALVPRERPVCEDLSTFLRILVLKDASQVASFTDEHIMIATDDNAREALNFLIVPHPAAPQGIPKK
ncbi:hypothetical protein MTO96_012375 [Rhipicephalus appendiculatus]